jgi:hypothetical protein
MTPRHKSAAMAKVPGRMARLQRWHSSSLIFIVVSPVLNFISLGSLTSLGFLEGLGSLSRDGFRFYDGSLPTIGFLSSIGFAIGLWVVSEGLARSRPMGFSAMMAR